jgi:hypothetical protein
MAGQCQQPALVAGNQVIGVARFGQAPEKIVGRIGRALDARQPIDLLGKLLQITNEPGWMRAARGQTPEY